MQDNHLTRRETLKGNGEILVLPSWYPNRLDVFAGDFVKRHVEAIALLHYQHVIFVVKDEHGALTKGILETRNEFENYSELIIYYHIKKTGIGILDRFRSDRKYLQLYKKHLGKYVREKGAPLLCHVHLAMKAGLAAIWLKMKYHVPFLVTEHWSGYLSEAQPRFVDRNGMFQKRTKNILGEAEVVTAVSSYLEAGIKKLFPGIRTAVIPNVVDTNIFYPTKKEAGKTTRFIHASTMSYPKNIEKIFQAFQLVRSGNYDFRLDLFGPKQSRITELIKYMSLDDHVFLKGDVSYKALAGEMQQSDALIQFSRFETFGCVVIEANAAGIPVFISDIPALRELISDNKNGFVVKADDSQALAAKLIAFMKGDLPLEKEKIVANTNSFSYQTVGKQFEQLYSDIINCPK